MILERTAYGIARQWLNASRSLGMKTPSLRESMGLRKNSPSVIALGGASAEQIEGPISENLISMLASGMRPIIVHGGSHDISRLQLNNPQKKLWECIEISQKKAGDELLGCLKKAAKRRGMASLEAVVVPVRVAIDPKDPAFLLPSKPIGLCYTLYELDKGDMGKLIKLSEVGYYKFKRYDGQEWIMKEVGSKPGQIRRVVPSPRPLKILDKDLKTINEHYDNGYLVITMGGGGQPVSLARKKGYEGTYQAIHEYHEALIDQDLAAALLAKDLRAREMIISTNEKYVSLSRGEKSQQEIGYFWAKQMLSKLKQGHFPAGSLGEKIEAGINFLRNGGNRFLITSPGSDWTEWEGTLATRGLDITGRLRCGRGLQRWLV